MNHTPEKRIIEALLFATSQPVSVMEISKRVPEGVDVLSVIEELKKEYQERGIELVERDKAWTFRTAHDLSDSLKLEREVPKKLSRAAMETLAIIAYHQPITRPEIETIRGVAVNKGTLDLLLEEGWITLGRRRDVPGRPVTWKTTKEFLDAFGLESLKDLPGLDELKASGLLDLRPAIQVVGGEGVENTMDLFEKEENDKDAFDIFEEDNQDSESIYFEGEEKLK